MDVKTVTTLQDDVKTIIGTGYGGWGFGLWLGFREKWSPDSGILVYYVFKKEVYASKFPRRSQLDHATGTDEWKM